MPPRRRAQLPVDLGRLRIPRALGLRVAWRVGRHLEGGDIRMSPSVAEHLREAARTTITHIQEGELRPYGADMYLEAEEALYVNDAELIATSPLNAILF